MSTAASSRDNWERLVAAVLKRDQIWQLCHQDSITTISSDFSQRPLSLSLRHVSPSPSPDQLPLTNASVVKDRKNASGTITQKLFSALLWRRKPLKDDHNIGEGLIGIPEDHFGVERLSLRELLVATDNFSNKNILGRGGHGTVYKGRLADGSLVAVKRFRAQTDQGMIDKELEISSLVSHRNVVHLRGFCITQKEQLLVYPYMANGSVASCLRERSESQRPLDWAIRQWIALGAAKGLAYLHHECVRGTGIIHRDIKAANILLDENFEAVVADFTLAKFVERYDDEVVLPKFVECYDYDDGFITGVNGTVGHIAPEYLATGKCSRKTDVYGYGIFLLELVTGRRAFDLGRAANYEDVMLLDWVRKLFERKSLEVMVDVNLQDSFVEEDMEKLLQIALMCTQSYLEGRPTMQEVVRMLEDGDGMVERWQDFSKNVHENENYYPEGRPTMPEVVRMLEDGDGMAERWQESSQNVYKNENYYPEWTIHDSTSSNASADQLSGPR